MSGAVHTPGPWLLQERTVYALDESEKSNRFSCRVQGGFQVRRVVEHGERTSDVELDANARLIAAAPELLEALEAISEGHLPDQPAASSLDEYEWAVQHVRKLRKIARAAIARAKGETQ
jgi:hypothetical protein